MSTLKKDSIQKRKNQKERRDPKTSDESSRANHAPENSIGWFLSEHTLSILVFLFALFFIITIANPALFLNDGWISANQLHQLDEGTQLIVNEGKYGVFINGTPGPYFEARNNLLGYTLMLPLLSFPALKFFYLFGDQFRFSVILLWSILPVLIALLIEIRYPERIQFRGIRLTIPIIGLAFAGLLANIWLYNPFPFISENAPREVAAIIFTNHILFSLMAVMIFLICKSIFEDDWYALFGTLVCISCSSYIFWATDAKDHILVATLITAVILFFARYTYKQRNLDAALIFIAIGLLAWARPELGFTVFIACVLSYFSMHIVSDSFRQSTKNRVLCILLTPLWTFFGAIPFFVNNYIVTGNPLVPTLSITHGYYQERVSPGVSGEGSPVIIESTTDVIAASMSGEVSASGIPYPGGIEDVIPVLTHHFNLTFNTLFSDLFGILFAPVSGNMSLVAVSPIVVFAIILLPAMIWHHSERFSSIDRQMIRTLAFIACAIWAAYIQYLPLLNHDSGIIPDIRYLMPFYLPAGLLALFALRGTLTVNERWSLTLATLISVLLIPAILFFIMIIMQPFGGLYAGYTTFFTLIIYGCLAIALILLSLRLMNYPVPQVYLIGIIAILIAIPLGWQLMMTVLYSVAKFNGYPFWIPVIEQIYSSLIQVTDIS